ncbi:hypothetical protein LLG95_08490 [bacterium]|nr:hypothetical protein [bacterium]
MNPDNLVEDQMKNCAKLIILIVAFIGAIAFATNLAAAGDYSVEYAMLDLSGGPVVIGSNLEEDILGGDLQGLSLTSSQTYDIASIIRWPAPHTAAQNWILYQ